MYITTTREEGDLRMVFDALTGWFETLFQGHIAKGFTHDVLRREPCGAKSAILAAIPLPPKL